MKRVIITGASGFVGSYLVNEFLSNGYEVTSVVRNEKSDVSAFQKKENINIVYCELKDIQTLKEKLSGQYDYFLHFAWDSSAGQGRSDYALQLKNVEYSCNCVRLAKELGCKRFVFAGSIMAYEAKEFVLNNGAEPTPAYIYSISKLTAAMMAKTVAVQNNIEFIDVVISNIYGVGEKSERFLNATVKKIVSGTESIDLTTCEQLYDFIYVTDAVRQIRFALEKGEGLNSYYIGNKEQFKLRQFVEKIKIALNSDVKLNFGAVEFSGAYFEYKNVIDTDSVFNLGFVTEIDFETGVKLLKESIDVK